MSRYIEPGQLIHFHGSRGRWRWQWPRTVVYVTGHTIHARRLKPWERGFWRWVRMAWPSRKLP